MRSGLVSVSVVVSLLGSSLGSSLGSVAMAQPGLTPPSSVPPGYAPVVLTQDEVEILERGPFPIPQYVIGGIASSAMGLGIGHAIQGRWLDIGWVFTFGEVASFGLMLAGIAGIDFCGAAEAEEGRCNDNDNGIGAGGFVLGLLGFVGLRVWETIDAWVAPPRHNNRFEALERRVYGAPRAVTNMGPYLRTPMGEQGGTVAGWSFAF